MDVEVRIRDLPGLGKQYEIGCVGGSTIAVVLQNNGMRNLYTFEPDADSASSVLQLDDAQARALSAVLAGVHFRPAGDHDEPAAFGEVAIDWLTVGADVSSLDELGIADHATVTVTALVRGAHTVLKPGGDEPLRVGDRLLVVGGGDDVAAVRAAVTSAARR